MSIRSFSMADKAVIVFLKAPVNGFVKTRLAKALDEKQVLELYKGFVEDTLDAAKAAADVYIGYWPAEESAGIKKWLGNDFRYFVQQGDDLGRKMDNGFKHVFEKGIGSAILVGTDIPQFDPGIADRAFKILKKTDLVLGPAQDGGYYLIGFSRNRYRHEIFERIRWSSPRVMEQTLQRAADNDISCELVDALNDIDTIQDLKWLAAEVKNNNLKIGERTVSLLKKIDRDLGELK